MGTKFSFERMERVAHSFDGMNDEMLLDSRACLLTVGDLRKMFECTCAERDRIMDENSMEILGMQLRQRTHT